MCARHSKGGRAWLQSFYLFLIFITLSKFTILLTQQGKIMTQTTQEAKIYFKIFKAKDIASKFARTYRKYSVGGAYEDVPADYVIIGDGVMGTGIKDKSQADNTVIRINVGTLKEEDETAIYYRGTLNLTEEGRAALISDESQPEGQRSGVFGSLTNRDKMEVDVAGWVVKAETGKLYINCQMCQMTI